MTESSNLPQYEVFIINDTPSEKKVYTKVGSGWDHKNGKGINVVIANGISISGNVVLFPYNKKDDSPTSTPAAAE